MGDVSALTPGGVRIGAPAMTSRGLKEAGAWRAVQQHAHHSTASPALPRCGQRRAGHLPCIACCFPPLTSACSALPHLPADFATIADFMHECLEECKRVQSTSGKKLAEFTA